MTLTRGFTDDIKMISSDANLGAFQNEFLSETITRIGQNTSSPLNLSASFPLADSLLNISSSLVTAGDGGSKSVPPINSIVPSVTAHTTIDFQTGIVTGQTITVNGGAFTLPVGTIGEYTRYALVLRSDGTIDSIFSTQSVTIVGLTNAGTLLATLLNTAGLPIGWIDLLCDGVGTYRTAGSIISIIENSGIYRFGISGGGDLQAKLNAEITARNNADSTLQANINTEATSRANADSTLQSNLNTETTARANADSTLQANLNTETTARMNAVSTLQMNINTEITARANADSTLQSNLNVETTARMNTDSTLQTNLNTETTARANADSTLQSNLNVETTARMNTDSTLQTNLNTEATSRANADTTLQTNINTISNVGITAGNGIATSGTIGGNNLNVAVGPLASNWDTTGAYISVKTPASPANAVTKAYVDQLAITGGTIKEALLSDHQLKSGAVVAGILAAEVVYFNIIPIINDTIVITNGITTETYTFVASRSIAFQVTIAAGDPVTTMNNLWSAINTDSAAWISDWAVAGLDAINTIGVVIVIEANAASGVSPSRIYGTWATQANCNVVTYNTAPEYRTSQASSTLPTTDPAAGRFGIRKAIADLVDGEIHDCLETDTLRSWHPDTWAWLTLSGSGSLPNATAASGGGILGKVTFDSDLGLDVNSGVAQVKIDNSTIKFNISGQLIADQGNFNAEVTARMNADSTLQANINAEATSRANGDSTLQANINTEATTRTNADSTLQNNLNVETTARMNADSTLQTNLNTEVTARSNADSTLQANINTEATTRANADSTLQANIDAEVTARTNADNAEITARSNADITLQNNINAETTTRANADVTLQNNINAEITARSNAESTFQANIDAEATTRANADTTLQNNISTEITARSNADSTLQNNINAEITARNNADTTLQANINTEITARTNADNAEITTRANADTTLQNNINTEITARTNADNAETTARTNADTTLQANINTEATTRANADSTLQTNINTEITARNNADDAEITARSNADTTLQNNINAEITTRNNADSTLQANINSEITARSNSDSTLQSNINLLTNTVFTTISMTATVGTTIGCDTTSAPLTITAPSLPIQGQRFRIMDVGGIAVSNNITITTGNIDPIASSLSDFIINNSWLEINFTYYNGSVGWVPTR